MNKIAQYDGSTLCSRLQDMSYRWQGKSGLALTLAAARSESALLQRMMETISEPAVVVHAPGDNDRIVFANDAACRHFGVSRTALLVSSLHDFCMTGDCGMPEQGASVFRNTHRTAGGKFVPVEIVRSSFSYGGMPLHASFIRNVVAWSNSEEYRYEQQFHALAENSSDGIARYDRDCRRLYVNPACCRLAGASAAELLGNKPSEFPGDSYAAKLEREIAGVFASGRNVEFELEWQDKAGREISCQFRLSAERGRDGEVASVLAVGRDMTELYAFRRKVHQMSFYDELTALPNRALFSDRLRRMLDNAARHRQQAGVMIVDLDRFKSVNDIMGHAAGDGLLCEAAVRLGGCVRAHDTVARLGGDEYAILLPDIRSGEELGSTAGKILEAFNQPFRLEGKDVFVSCSIGIALYPGDSSGPDDLLKYSDSAMHYAKRSGRNNFRFYSKELTASANERLLLEADLRCAIGRGELELHFQPKVSLKESSVVGSEALLRWNHPQRGMVSPDKFMPIAEDSRLIVEIGEWVLRTACRAAATWNRPGMPLHKVAINLSPRQFQLDDLEQTVQRILAETVCDPAWIELEITESLLLDEDGAVLKTLQAFRALGITIAIDDFGTGYSALSYLARFPINTLKIDRSFTSQLEEYGQHAELVKAIISIAQCLGQQVVAEGVETAEQAAFLQAHGCQLVQGYFYGRPLRQAEFEAAFTIGEGAGR